MKKLIALSFLAAVAVTAPSQNADAQIVAIPGSFQISATPVSITCKNPGSSQDVAKTPSLTNSTPYAIPKGKTLSFKSSDGDYGTVKLEADLAPGASVKAMGKPGNGYTCTGTYMAYPDLAVASFTSQSTGFSVKIQNLDKHAVAAGSQVQIEFLSCSTNLPIGTAFRAPVSNMAAGGSATAFVAAAKPGKSYMRITADATKQVVEGNESNNSWTESYNSCVY